MIYIYIYLCLYIHIHTCVSTETHIHGYALKVRLHNSQYAKPSLQMWTENVNGIIRYVPFGDTSRYKFRFVLVTC